MSFTGWAVITAVISVIAGAGITVLVMPCIMRRRSRP